MATANGISTRKRTDTDTDGNADSNAARGSRLLGVIL